jgi:hypothetical protein
MRHGNTNYLGAVVVVVLVVPVGMGDGVTNGGVGTGSPGFLGKYSGPVWPHPASCAKSSTVAEKNAARDKLK